MNSFNKITSKETPTKTKSHQVLTATMVKPNNTLSTNSFENEGTSSKLGVVESKELMPQQVHPIVESSAVESAEPPSPPPSIHPAAHRPSSLTTQPSSLSASGGNYG